MLNVVCVFRQYNRLESKRQERRANFVLFVKLDPLITTVENSDSCGSWCPSCNKEYYVLFYHDTIFLHVQLSGEFDVREVRVPRGLASPGDTISTNFRWPCHWCVLWDIQDLVIVWLVYLNRGILVSKWSLKTDAGRNILRMVQSKMESPPPTPAMNVRISLQPWLCLGPHHNLKQFIL